MSDELSQLEDWAGTLLAKLEPKARRQLSRSIGIALRRSQQQRIAAQENPDGSAYTRRKPRKDLRGRQGRIKRAAMFTKLRQAKHLRLQTDDGQASIAFLGRVARIARVHQEGGTDAVTPGGPRVRYAQRQLLGFTDAERDAIREQLLEHLAT